MRPPDTALIALRQRKGQEDKITGCRLQGGIQTTGAPRAPVDEPDNTGSLHQAVLAAAESRYVRAVPGRRSNPWPTLQTSSTKNAKQLPRKLSTQLTRYKPREQVPASMGRNRQQCQKFCVDKVLKAVRQIDRWLQAKSRLP